MHLLVRLTHQLVTGILRVLASARLDVVIAHLQGRGVESGDNTEKRNTRPVSSGFRILEVE